MAHELVACIFECTTWQGTPDNREPEKHSDLIWCSSDSLPAPIIPAHQSALNLIAHGYSYSEHC